MKKLLLSLVLIQIILLVLTACGGGGASLSPNIDDNNSTLLRGKLVDSQLLATRSASFLLPYAVNAYKITYKTIDVDGQTINASGLIAVPNKDSIVRSPLLSYQHGTIFLDSQAPSNSSTSVNGIMTLAGTGYIVSAADFLGYGASANRIHPYLHADSLASASVDMLRASKAFLESRGVKINSQLFLAGYSEGGYATLALQKEILENLGNEFRVTASAAGAGPFDLSGTAKELANKAFNQKPAYMSFLLKAYDSIYNLNQVSSMFQPKFVNDINTVFDGKHSASAINSRLSTTTTDLFDGSFLSALQSETPHIIKEKLALNNIYDWKPNAPTRFYHSPNDEIVPYRNAQKVLSVMNANGASHISLVDCPFNTHVACAFPYVLNTLNFFSNFATDL